MAKETPFIIPVFIPHWGCPHQCLFCNQASITGAPAGTLSPDRVNQQIQRFLGFRNKESSDVQIAFFGGNFLGLSGDIIGPLLETAAGYVKKGMVNSIRFSTRPDTIDKLRLDRLTGFPVSTVELGVQSMDDRVLALSNRGHTARDTEAAVALLKERGYDIGLQMMVGLPGDDGQPSMVTAHRISSLLPDFVRIYPTLVLRGSPLAERYRNGEYEPLALGECVTLVKEIYHVFRENSIRVVRMGLQATEDLDRNASVLAGPYHPSFGHLVYSEIFLDKAAGQLMKMKPGYKRVIIRVHPRNLSRMQGMKKSNLENLKSAFHLEGLTVLSDKHLEGDELAIEAGDRA